MLVKKGDKSSIKPVRSQYPGRGRKLCKAAGHHSRPVGEGPQWSPRPPRTCSALSLTPNTRFDTSRTCESLS